MSRWFLAGLFLVSLSTLTLETLDTRLLSVLTWYHLSFFAVSLAMLGMAAGAVHVYLGGERFAGDAAPPALARFAGWLALAIPCSHLVNLSMPIVTEVSANGLLSLALSSAVLAVPFFLSGVVVTVALTRIPGPIGRIYAVDLLGAALGSLVLLGLLELANITSAVFATGALAAIGWGCLRVFAGVAGAWRRPAAVAGVLVVLALANSASPHRVRVATAKGVFLPAEAVLYEDWSLHGQVVARRPGTDPPRYWAAGKGAPRDEVEWIGMLIDAGAGTTMTRWDGDRGALEWTAWDVTSLPYHLRRGGHVAIIGVGGGRDVLAALHAGSASVTGVEINPAFLRLLEGPLADFAGIASQPEVRLVHDEARSWLTRSQERYDVLQLSMADTWAATGAGAWSLTENGLYTVEAWEVFLARLRPDGLLSVSRWFAPTDVSETSRLVSLATAALLRSGVESPEAHLALVSREQVATLLVSPSPLSRGDLATLEATASRLGFRSLLVPGEEPVAPLLGRIASARSLEDIEAAVDGEPWDYSPPTDERPFFFNLVRPGRRGTWEAATRHRKGVISGNLLATWTLLALLGVVATLTVTLVLGPLAARGLPRLDRGAFAAAVAWFGLIGAGFMLVQIALMQRFSIYLGYPTYAVAVVLAAMILAAGAGSLLSDRLPVEDSRLTVSLLPLAAVLPILGLVFAVQPLVSSTIGAPLAVRCALAAGAVAVVSAPLGVFFPLGLRLVRRLSNDATPWMWGVNGAAGVLAAVCAVAVSLWVGIHTNLIIAAVAYGLLVGPGLWLWSRCREQGIPL